jgi:ATP-binding cassette subfamily B protein
MHFDLRLWSLTEGFRVRITWAVIMGLISSLAGIVRLVLLGWMLGLALSGANLNDLILPGAITASVIIFRAIWDYLKAMSAHHTGVKIQRGIRAKIYDHVIKLGPARFAHSRTGDITTAAIDGVEHLGVYYSKYLPAFFVALATPPMIFLFVAYLDLSVAMVLLAAALFTLFAPALFHNWDSKHALSRSHAFKDYSSSFLDALQGLATLKSFGRSKEYADTLGTKALKLTDTTKWVLATSSLTRGITDTGIAVGAAGALGFGALKVNDGSMSLETLLIILMLGVEVFRPLRDLRSVLHDGMLSLAASKQIFGILDEKPLIEDVDFDSPASVSLEPTIEFSGVQFQYPGGRGLIHNDVSFEINAGERVAIVGPSGSGKSSIVRLLSRFYDPDNGSISIGGQGLTTLSFAQIRKQLAIVSQDTHLFHGNVTENLLFGNPNATPEEIERAAIAANAHKFIMELPNGYDTVVGERGVRLSGGQRQRIAIARALLRDAPILILDEALSSVDAENEAVIQDALDRLMVGRTTLILAHRLSSVIGADRILVLNEGKINEQGTHEELMKFGGTYSALMSQQVEDRNKGKLGQKVKAQKRQTITSSSNKNEHGKSQRLDSLLRADGLGWGGAIKELMTYVMPWKGRLVMTFGLGVSRVIAFIGVSALSALAVAAVKNDQPFLDYLYILAVLAPAAGVLHWLESWVAHDMAFNLLADMRIKLFKKLDQLAPAFLTRQRSGDIVSLATHDVDMVEYFFAHTIAPAFVAILVPASVLILLYSFHWSLAVALIPCLLAVALTPVIMRSRIDRIGSEVREAFGLLSSHTVETVQGLNEVLSFEAAKSRRTAFLDMVDWFQDIRLPFMSDNNIRQVFVEAITGVGVLSVILTGTNLVSAGTIDGAYMPLLALVSMAAFLPVSEIADVGRQLANTLGATQRLKAVHDEEVKITDGDITLSPPEYGGMEVTFENVTFTYPLTDIPALNNVSLALPAGKTVALVGPSGAGKSTLAHLLMRFWDPDNGHINLQGVNFKDCKLDQLRNATALVAQDTYLFNDTLLANLKIANPDASQELISAALEQASLKEFVDSLPDGLETYVGERGFSLSGGQRQRVAIARAFLKDAPILILDEATSHLDSISERTVHTALSALMHDRTTLVIAHRLSTIRGADLILVMNQGQIAETGTHAELLEKGGLYAELIDHQMTAGVRVAAE